MSISINIINEIIKTIENRYDSQFNCLKCGLCCLRVIKSREDNYGFNYDGNYIEKPKISATLTNLEKPILEKKILEKHYSTPTFIPAFALFLKKSKVGFIQLYQVPIKDNNCCFYYNKKEKKCKIYNARPSSCKVYPLTLTNGINITFASECEYIKKTFPDLEKNMCVNVMNHPIKFEFKKELLLETFFIDLIKQQSFALRYISSLFYPLNYYDNKFNSYELKDFNDFIKWANKNLKTDNEIKLLNKYREKIKKINQELKIFKNQIKD